ncbi:hypothetical protein MAR_015337, partial [Mya arenaria]
MTVSQPGLCRIFRTRSAGSARGSAFLRNRRPTRPVSDRTSKISRVAPVLPPEFLSQSLCRHLGLDFHRLELLDFRLDVFNDGVDFGKVPLIAFNFINFTYVLFPDKYTLNIPYLLQLLPEERRHKGGLGSPEGPQHAAAGLEARGQLKTGAKAHAGSQLVHPEPHDVFVRAHKLNVPPLARVCLMDKVPEDKAKGLQTPIWTEYQVIWFGLWSLTIHSFCEEFHQEFQ